MKESQKELTQFLINYQIEGGSERNDYISKQILEVMNSLTQEKI